MDKRAKREELLGELQDIEQMLDKPHTPGYVPTLSDIVGEGTISDDSDQLDDSNIPTLGDLDQYEIAPTLDPVKDSLPEHEDTDIPMLDDVFDNGLIPESNQQDLLHAIDPPLPAPQEEPTRPTEPKVKPKIPVQSDTGENPFLPKAILEKLASERHAAETEAANALETLKPNHAIADEIDPNSMRHEIEIALDSIVQDVLDEYLPKIRQEIEQRLQKSRQAILNTPKFRS